MAWWALLSSAGSVAESVLRAVPAWGWTLALGIAIGAVGHARWTERTAPRPGLPEIEYRDAPLTKQDLQPPSPLARITRFPAPDSQETRTDCITVPSWLDSPTTLRATDASSAAPKDTGPRADTSVSLATEPTITMPSVDGLPYVITPMTRGRPSLSVGPRRVRLSAILPTTGAGRTYTWAVPPIRNRLAGGLQARGSSAAVSAAAEVRYEHVLFREGALSVWGQVGAGYRQSVGPARMAGPYGTAGIKVQLAW
jgi:hypothetical protein